MAERLIERLRFMTDRVRLAWFTLCKGLPVEMEPKLHRIGEDVPDVGECYGHQRERAQGNLLASCPQCDGSHDHVWVVCVKPERSYQGGAVPIRCRICGGRKCDNEGCTQRRHHSEPHLYADGTIRKVGA